MSNTPLNPRASFANAAQTQRFSQLQNELAHDPRDFHDPWSRAPEQEGTDKEAERFPVFNTYTNKYGHHVVRLRLSEDKLEKLDMRVTDGILKIYLQEAEDSNSNELSEAICRSFPLPPAPVPYRIVRTFEDGVLEIVAEPQDNASSLAALYMG